MGRAVQTVGATLVATLALAGAVQAACPYPLGEFAARGQIVVWDWDGEVEDLEHAIVEATLIHGQKSFGQVVNAQGQLHFVYNAEVEFELPGGAGEAETHSIFYKRYSNDTGWDVPIVYLASPDPTVELPPGRNVQSYAAALGADLWAFWEGSGRLRENGSYILMRGVTGAGVTTTYTVAPDWADSANKLAKAVTVGDSLYVAFQTNLYSNAADEFRIVGRSFDGTTLGPFENISLVNDGWSDQVVTLATDGARVFAAWLAQNVSDLSGSGDWDVMLAVRAANGTWGAPVQLTAPGKELITSPSAAWFLDRLFVAYPSDNDTLDSRGDLDIVMQSYSPDTGVLGPLLQVSTDDFHGTEVSPSLFAWPASAGGDGKLHILWSSDSTPNSIPTSGTDNDIFYRVFDGGGFGDIRLVSDPMDNGFVEDLPGFFAVGDSLYAYFLSNICLPGCGHETDWREMTRLLERPAHFYDGVSATYSTDSTYPTALAAEAHIHFTHADGSPAGGGEYFAKTASGRVVPLAVSNGSAVLAITFNASAALQLTASYCGRELPTTEQAPQLPPPPSRPAPVGDIVAPALAAAALLGAVRARRGCSR